MIDALIIAPEITKGMKSIGSKALLQIKKQKCVLDYQIEAIKNIDKNINITIATGFESDKIIELLYRSYKNEINYIYDPNFRTTNQAESINIFLNKFPETQNLFIVLNGVVFKNRSITKTMLDGESKAFILSKQKENFSLGCTNGDNIEYIFYDLPNTWSECVYLNRNAIVWTKEYLSSKAVNQMYLFEILNEIIAHKIIIEHRNIDKKNIMKINGPKDINKAKLFI
jgi:hypothetical protein